MKGLYPTIPLGIKKTLLFLLPAAEGLKKRPLLLMLMGLVMGILLGHGTHDPRIITMGLLVLTLGCGGMLPRHRTLAALMPLFALAGVGLMAPWIEHTSPLFMPTGPPIPWQGRITQPISRGQDLICVLRDIAPLKKTGPAPLFSAMRLSIKGGDALPAAEGMLLSTTCRPRPFTNFDNPGGFDYRRYMARKGIGAWATVKAKEVSLETAPSMYRWQTLLHRARRHIEGVLSDHAPTPYSKALLYALITGNRSLIPQPMRDLFIQTGISHLLAISGLHLGVVTALFFSLFKHLFSLWERPLIKGHTQAFTAMATLIPVSLYALLSGLAPSTQRALVAAALLLGSLPLHEEVDLPTTLALAALIILAIHPPALFSISFQLSFAAVAAIVAGLNRYPRRKKAHGSPSLRQRILIFITPAWCASLGTAPLVWYHFGYIAPIGLIANLILVPIVSFGIILPGLAGVILLPILAPISGLCFLLSGHTAEIAMRIATLFTRIPGGFFTLPRPGIPTTLLVLLLLFSLILPHGGRRKGPITLALCCLLLLGYSAQAAFKQRHTNPHLEVTVLDVGQGSSLVIAFPHGKRWLVDGGFAWPEGYDVGRFAVAPYLQKAQITTLDAVVLTHPESDHMGGLIHILNHFTVKELITSPYGGKGELWEKFCAVASHSGIPRRYLTAQDLPMQVEGVEITCLHPPGPPSIFSGKGAVNNNSLVLQLVYGTHRFLLTGDIMKRAEARLLEKRAEALKADILIIPHHGSATSSTPAFVARVRPSVGVVSAGEKNRYRLPHKKVLARYTQAGCLIYRTDHHGAITIESDGTHLRVSSFLSPLPDHSLDTFPPET